MGKDDKSKGKKEPTKEEIKAKKEKRLKEILGKCTEEENEFGNEEKTFASDFVLMSEPLDGTHRRNMFAAAEKGQLEDLKSMIRDGSTVNQMDQSGHSPLIYACQSGQFETAVLLIEQKANVNQKSKYGFTPLMFAAWHGHKNVVSLLLRHNADVKVTNVNKDTALHFAALSGHLMICLMLRKAGADENAKNNKKKSPLDHMKNFSDDFNIVMSLPAVEKVGVEFQRSHKLFGIQKVASELGKYALTVS